MTTFQITLPEPLRQFALGRVAELGLDSPDQYFEQLLEEDRLRKRDEFYMEKVREAIEQDEWVTEDQFWNQIDENTRTRRKARTAWTE